MTIKKRTQSIENLKNIIKGLNDLTIKHPNNKKMIEDFNNATDMLERLMAEEEKTLLDQKKLQK